MATLIYHQDPQPERAQQAPDTSATNKKQDFEPGVYIITAGPNYEQLELAMRHSRNACPHVVQMMVMPCEVQEESDRLKLHPMLSRVVPMFARVLGIQLEGQMDGVRLTMFIQDKVHQGEPLPQYDHLPLTAALGKRRRITASYNCKHCTGGIALHDQEPVITSQHKLRLWDVGEKPTMLTVSDIAREKVSPSFISLHGGWNSGYYLANPLKTR